MGYRFLFLTIFFGVALGGDLFASPAEEKEPAPKDVAVLDDTQDFFGNQLNSLANRIDSFFATERADDELNRSRLRIRPQYTVRERALPEKEVDYRINLKLPKLQEKFRFNYKKEEKKKKITAEQAKNTAARNQVKSGWTFNADAGGSVAVPPRLVTRARLRKNFEVGSWINRFAEEVTYITDESGLTEETIFQNDHKINVHMLFRFQNRKRWRVLRKEFQTFHGPSILHQITENDAFSYNALMTFTLDDGVYWVTGYSLSVNYRRNLYKNWVYLDLVPGIDFPKVWSFRRTPFIFAQLELLFGG